VKICASSGFDLGRRINSVRVSSELPCRHVSPTLRIVPTGVSLNLVGVGIVIVAVGSELGAGGDCVFVG
jgi:hypothetical protein